MSIPSGESGQRPPAVFASTDERSAIWRQVVKARQNYFTVAGYNDGDATVKIADPASFSGNQIYWLSFDQLASLIPPKGYAA